ncbi:unnamed protein product [Leuciscus chuanchicus]
MKHYLDEGLEENLAYDLEKGLREDPEGSEGPQAFESSGRKNSLCSFLPPFSLV